MKIKVTKDLCEIKENEIWNVGDYNVHTVQVELSPEFNGLVNKVRYFVEDNSYDMLITDNVAQVPYEATVMEGTIKIGVYGYDADTDILVQSTSPVNKYITSGTYTGDPDNTQPLTPTDKEQMESAIQKNTNDITDLKANKQGTLISGVNIKTINNESILSSGNLTLVTEETDPIFTNSPAYSITDNDITYWNNKLDQSDLNDYVKNTDYASSSTGGVIKTAENNGFAVSSAGNLYAVTRTFSTYSSDGDALAISKGTLENVITGKNLETANNKVTSISSSSTDVQYPSAKCVYDNDVIIKDDVNTKYDYLFSLTNLFGKITGTGTSVTLNDTSNTIMKLNLDTTTSSQATTTGKNKWSLNSSYTTETGNQYVLRDTTIETIPAGTYILSLEKSVDNNVFFTFKGDGSYQKTVNLNNVTSNTVEFTSDVNKAAIYIYGSEATTISNIMISTNGGDYEPYTGGQPAPSPSYPQAIHTVSGDNTIKITNKNLFNINNANWQLYSSSYPPTYDNTNKGWYNKHYMYLILEPTVTQTISFKIKKRTLESGEYNYSGTWELRKDGVVVTYNTGAGSDTYVDISYTMEANHTYRLTVYNHVFINYIQIEDGSSATSYEPYKQQTYSINLGDIEFCKIGDYKDVLFKNTLNSEYYDSSLELNKWYLKNNIGKLVLDGNEDYDRYSSLDTANYNCFYLTRNNFFVDSSGTITTTISNYFLGQSFNDRSNNIANMWVNKFASQLYFKVPNTITTSSELKTWLNTHNTIVYYVLATPTYTLLNDTLQTQLNNLQYALAYDTQTNISQTNTDLPFIIDAETFAKIGG